MVFLVDSFLFLLNYLAYRLSFSGRKEKVQEEGIEEARVIALLPVKKERAEVIKKTLDSLAGEVDKIWILPSQDKETRREVSKIEASDQIEVHWLPNKSKASVLNHAISEISGYDYILVIDAGDILEEGFVKKSFRVMGERDEACVPILTNKQKRFWKAIVNYEIVEWTSNVLRRLFLSHGFCPLPGTGLILKLNFVKRQKFPETLAEDAALGIFAKKVAFSNAKLYYNLPSFYPHLKQRARWIAGFLQNLSLARTSFQRFIFLSPVITGLVPVSLMLIPFSFLLGLNISLVSLLDLLAGICLFTSISLMLGKCRDWKVFLMPLFWFFWGLSFYLGIYYLLTGKWYQSPKS